MSLAFLPFQTFSYYLLRYNHLNSQAHLFHPRIRILEMEEEHILVLTELFCTPKNWKDLSHFGKYQGI